MSSHSSEGCTTAWVSLSQSPWLSALCFCLDCATSCLDCAAGVRDASNFVVSVISLLFYLISDLQKTWHLLPSIFLPSQGEVCSKLWTLQCIQSALTFCLLDPISFSVDQECKWKHSIQNMQVTLNYLSVAPCLFRCRIFNCYNRGSVFRYTIVLIASAQNLLLRPACISMVLVHSQMVLISPLGLLFCSGIY